MDELQKALDIALDRALGRAGLPIFGGKSPPGQWPCRRWRRWSSISAWGFSPDRPDRILDRQRSRGWILRKISVRVRRSDLPPHCHRRKHETFFVVKGRVRMTFDGVVRDMGEGAVLPVPPGKKHCFTGLGPALLLELSKPCEVDDNYFDDIRIPIGGNWRGEQPR